MWPDFEHLEEGLLIRNGNPFELDTRIIWLWLVPKLKHRVLNSNTWLTCLYTGRYSLGHNNVNAAYQSLTFEFIYKLNLENFKMLHNRGKCYQFWQHKIKTFFRADSLMLSTHMAIPHWPPWGPLPQDTSRTGAWTVHMRARPPSARPLPPSVPRTRRGCLSLRGPTGRQKRGCALREKRPRAKRRKNDTPTLEGEQDICGEWKGKKSC